MRLKVNFIAGGGYWKVGEEVPDSVVPEFARQWSIDENGNGNVSSEPKKPLPKAVRERKRLLRSIRGSKQ